MSTLRQRLSQFAPYFQQGRPGLWIAALCSLIGAGTEAAIAAGMEPLLDRGFRGELPLWLVPAGIVALLAIRGLSGYVAECSLVWSAQKGVESLRRALFGHLMQVKPALFTHHSASGLTNILVYEVQHGVQQLVQAALVALKDSLTIVALLSYLLWAQWQLTMVVALLIPGVALIIRLITPRLRRLTLEGIKAVDELAYVVEENALAWRVVRLHGAQQAQAERFHAKSVAVRRLTLKSVAAAAAITPLTQLFAAVAISIVVAFALHQASGGGITVGSFVAFVMAMMALLQPIKRVTDLATPLTRGLAALERGMTLLHESPAEQGGGHQPTQRARGEIELQDLSLRYRDDQAPALDRVNLRVRPGEAVALVGPSGAGKTTLINLLPRFLEPTEGHILLDGQALAQWDVHALRRQFALVSQDVVLFNGSVAANVALGEVADEQRVREALRAANLLDFVETLPQGIHSTVGHNGSQLSGGQRQRVAIARAIYKDAPILILDEATSALDTESERAVQQALERLMHGRTTLVIAHRLSTIENADRIVVMDAGRVAEQGTHAQLLQQGGLYARLHAMQFRT